MSGRGNVHAKQEIERLRATEEEKDQDGAKIRDPSDEDTDADNVPLDPPSRRKRVAGEGKRGAEVKIRVATCAPLSRAPHKTSRCSSSPAKKKSVAKSRKRNIQTETDSRSGATKKTRGDVQATATAFPDHMGSRAEGIAARKQSADATDNQDLVSVEHDGRRQEESLKSFIQDCANEGCRYCKERVQHANPWTIGCEQLGGDENEVEEHCRTTFYQVCEIYLGKGIKEESDALKRPSFPDNAHLVLNESNSHLLQALLRALKKCRCLTIAPSTQRCPWVKAFCNLYHPAGPWGSNSFSNVPSIEDNTTKHRFRSDAIPELYELLQTYEGSNPVHLSLRQALEDYFSRYEWFEDYLGGCEKIAAVEANKPLGDRAAIPTCGGGGAVQVVASVATSPSASPKLAESAEASETGNNKVKDRKPAARKSPPNTHPASKRSDLSTKPFPKAAEAVGSLVRAQSNETKDASVNDNKVKDQKPAARKSPPNTRPARSDLSSNGNDDHNASALKKKKNPYEEMVRFAMSIYRSGDDGDQKA